MGKKALILVVAVIMLMAAMPLAAQESSGEIQIRFLNLDLEAQETSFTAMIDTEELNNGEAWALEPAPSLSEYYALPAETTAMGLTVNTADSFGGSGFTTSFRAGHSYLVLLVRVTDTDGETDNEYVFIDETTLFGSGAASAGLARLLIIQATNNPAAYTVADKIGNSLFTQFLAIDPDEFDFIPPRNAIGLAPEIYQLSVVDDAGTALIQAAPLTLAADQLTMLVGTDGGIYAVIGSEVTILE